MVFPKMLFKTNEKVMFFSHLDAQALEKSLNTVRVCLTIGISAGSIALIMISIGTFFKDVFLMIAFIPEMISSKFFIKNTALKEGFHECLKRIRLRTSYFEDF